MKIALLSPGLVGHGTEAHSIPCLSWLIEHLRAAGHEVHVFVPGQEAESGSGVGSRPWQLRMLRSLTEAHRQGRFEVIHAFWSSLGFVGALAAGILGVPLIVTLPGGDMASLPDIGYGGRTSLKGRLNLRVATLAARAIIVPSNFMREMAARLGIQAEVVPFGVSLEQWPASPPRQRDRSQPLRLLHVASLNRVKDQSTLLRAMSILKARGVRFDLRIVGFDTLSGEIQRLARDLELDGVVQFAGALPHRELRPEYEQADLLVITSRHDAGPMVMMEAAVCGVPTVGTCVGHIADQAPAAAIAVPIGDSPALADAIATLGHDEVQRLAIAAAAQAFALEHDARRSVHVLEAIYCGVRASGAQSANKAGV